MPGLHGGAAGRLASLMLAAMLFLVGAGCIIGRAEAGFSEPFTSRLSAEDGTLLEVQGFARGHRTLKQSAFTLTLSNRSFRPWQNEYCMALLGPQGVVQTLVQESFVLAPRETFGNTVFVTFTQDLRQGPYGLAVLVPQWGTLVSTIHLGDGEAPGMSPWPGQVACPERAVTQEESRLIAQRLVHASPTYIFDGIEGSLVLMDVVTLRCPYCWEFVFRFQSRHAGYGDRTGQPLMQVITPHVARIVVERGRVTRATLDDRWDILAQRLIQ